MAIQVTYRYTRRLSMRIAKNGDVHVSAPVGMSRKTVEAFIELHQQWIAEARKKTAERQSRRTAFYNQLPLTTKAQKAEATERVRALVEPMIGHYSTLMGVSPASVNYKPMISRWGMCNVKDHSICFSTYLLLLLDAPGQERLDAERPHWLVEHVVVHELCHLLEPSHNARFHALMNKFFPRWKEARKETRLKT